MKFKLYKQLVLENEAGNCDKKKNIRERCPLTDIVSCVFNNGYCFCCISVCELPSHTEEEPTDSPEGQYDSW